MTITADVAHRRHFQVFIKCAMILASVENAAQSLSRGGGGAAQIPLFLSTPPCGRPHRVLVAISMHHEDTKNVMIYFPGLTN